MKTLKTRAEFQRVRDGGKWVAKAFVLQCLARRDEGTAPGEEGSAGPRFGFAVGSRALMADAKGPAAGKGAPAAKGSARTKGAPPAKGAPAKRPGAVMRNRARRRLKEAVRLAAPASARDDFDYVVIGRREALHQCFADLLEDMQLAFDRVHRPPRAKGAGAKPGPDRDQKTRERAVGADQRKN